MSLPDDHRCRECGGRLLAVSAGAVCEHGCGRILGCTAYEHGTLRRIHQNDVRSSTLQGCLEKLRKDWS